MKLAMLRARHQILRLVKERTAEEQAELLGIETQLNAVPPRPEIVAHDDAVTPVTDAEIDALRHAAWHARSKTHGDALISLLRKLAPLDETLYLMDRQAHRQGYVRAGSDELLPGAAEVLR